jgi:hypothetical protein
MISSTEIRTWANESDNFEGFVGKRGRLGPVIKGAFFAANPKVAREVAVEAGIEVPARGRIGEDTLAKIVNVLP